ncbi:hypothetical protein [Hymenobacter metallicola]|uniref:Uncharacterized protein n=1 Tax=Hymenobacter metallicola TaxID=2563114 RepID=A0A4Z0PVB1_9BACT|nr:hypothetical protein [Hymenobacter metallicola]TGE20911.1 hypothetical protein E5K02_25255 [Hymenobacter metallicola]
MDSSTTTDATGVSESYWTAVGNIVRERPYGPGGAEIRFGTKHFAPGAKVYIINWYAGMCQSIIVVGMHRKSKRFITLALDVRLVENLRPQVCYNPAVIAKLKEHFSPKPHFNPGTINSLTKEFAEQVCATIPHWQQNYKNADRVAPVPAPEFESHVTWRQRVREFFGFLPKS